MGEGKWEEVKQRKEMREVKLERGKGRWEIVERKMERRNGKSEIGNWRGEWKMGEEKRRREEVRGKGQIRREGR